MIEFESRLRRWGRSFGIVVPMEKLRKEKFGADEDVMVTVSKKKNPLKETFGTVKLSRSTKEILDEGDRESWNE